jgi:hypothetical protein
VNPWILPLSIAGALVLIFVVATVWSAVVQRRHAILYYLAAQTYEKQQGRADRMLGREEALMERTEAMLRRQEVILEREEVLVARIEELTQHPDERFRRSNPA